MRILSITLNGLLDENVDKLYCFDQLNENSKTVFFDGNDVPAVINYVFLDKTIGINCDGSAEIVFRVKNDDYIISRTRADGKDSVVLKQTVDGKSQRLSKPYEKLTQIFECDLTEQFSGYLIDKAGFERFEKSPSLFAFDSINKIRETAETARKSYEQVLQQAQVAERNIKGMAKKVPEVTEATVQSFTQLWNEKEKEYRALDEQINGIEAALKTAQNNSPLKEEQLANERKIIRLLKTQAYVDVLREKIDDHYKVQKLIPKLQEIFAYRKQVAEAAARVAENRKQSAQLADERGKYAASLEALNEEIKQLLESSARVIVVRDEEADNIGNVNIEETLAALEKQKETLNGEIAALKARVAELDAIIAETGSEAAESSVPVVSIPELIENIRKDIQIKELQSAIANKDADIARLREKIEEKEKLMQAGQGSLTNLLALDKAVSPLKGSEEINRLLQSKIKKNEFMIESLEAKGNRLEQEIRTLDAREREIDLSLGGLQSALTDKQNDRDKFLKLQALNINVENGVERDRSLVVTSSVPMSSVFIDEHVASLQGDIEKRTSKKIEIISEKVALEYVLKEIKRQKDIAASDIAASLREQQQLETKIEQIAARTSDELAQKYLQAFKAGSATEFILSYQKEIVKTQTEYEMLVADVNKKLHEKAESAARLDELCAGANAGGLDELLSGDLKNANHNPAQRLIAAQQERANRTDSIKEKENAVVDINAKTMQYQQYQAAMRRGENIKSYTKDEAERLNEEYETSMKKLLAEKEVAENNISTADNAILNLKIEGEKFMRELQQLKDTSGGKRDLATRLMDDLQGESLGSIKQKNLAPQDLEKYRSSVEKFDKTLAELRNQSDIIRLKMSDETENKEVADLQRRHDQALLKRRQSSIELERLKKKMNEAMDGYLAYNRYKVDMAKASNELAVAENLKEALKQTKNVEQMYKQKLGKYVKAADKIFGTLTLGQYYLDVQDDILFVDKTDGKSVEFSEMTIINRYMAYLALRAALPGVSNGSCDTVVLKGEIRADKNELTERLLLLTDKNFITRIGRASETKKTSKAKA